MDFPTRRPTRTAAITSPNRRTRRLSADPGPGQAQVPSRVSRPGERASIDENAISTTTSLRVRRSSAAGYSLLELLITVSVLGILVAGAGNGLGDTMARKQLAKAAQAVEQELQLARRESAKRDTNLVVSFATGASWCLGTDVAACDCTTAADCGVGEVSATAFSDAVSMSAASFSGVPSVTMDRIRRTVSSSGTVDLQTTSGRDLRVEVLATGRTRLCSPSDNMTGYPSC